MPPTPVLRRRAPWRPTFAPARLVPAVLVAATAVVAGCGSSGGPLTIGPDQNGQTVTVSSGQKVVVMLTGANWQFTLDPAFGPLTETATHFSAGRTSSSTVDFVARTHGTATVHATRAACGKSACRDGQGRFTVRVTVGS